MRVRGLIALVVVLAAPALARAGGQPIDMAVASITAPDRVGAGEPFSILPNVGINPDKTTGLPPAPYSLHFSTTLPAGLTMLDAHWPGNLPVLANCLSECLYEMTSPSDRGYQYDLVAAAPGSYTVTVAITSTSNPDPDKSNDSQSATITVVPLTLRLATSGATPARAGKSFTWTGHLTSTVSGHDVRASSAACTARIGARAIKGRSATSVGKVKCTFAVPPRTSGKKLVVSAVAKLAAATATAVHTYAIR